MKLSTGLDIVNGLSICRDMFEAKAYLRANNIDISDQELEVLQSQYSKTNSERTLTEELLNKVAGGGKSLNGGSPRTKSLDAGRKRSLSASDIDFNFSFRQDAKQRLELAEHRMDEAAKILGQQTEKHKEMTERTIKIASDLPAMQELYVSEYMDTVVEVINGFRQENFDQQQKIIELNSRHTQTLLELEKIKQQRDSLKGLVYRMRGLDPHRLGEAQDQVSSLSEQEYGRTSRHYAPTPVPPSVPDPEPAPRLKPTYSIDPKPIEKSSSFSSRMPVVRVTASSKERYGEETDSDTSPESASPPESSARLHMGNPLLQKNLA